MFCLVLLVSCVTWVVANPLNAEGIVRSPRIVNGSETTIEQRPFQADLIRCGGSIIGKKWILTAAHCSSAIGTSVKVGSQQHNKGHSIKIKHEIIHPEYDEHTMSYDFMLLELEEELVFNDRVKPIELDNGDLELPGEEAIASGWGHIIDRVNVRLQNLLAVNIRIMDDEACVKALEDFGLQTYNDVMCATAPGKDSCQGDSGGPLTVGNVLVGVISWGENCASAKYPGVYARVSAVRDWIEKETGI